MRVCLPLLKIFFGLNLVNKESESERKENDADHTVRDRLKRPVGSTVLMDAQIRDNKEPGTPVSLDPPVSVSVIQPMILSTICPSLGALKVT